MGVGRGCACPGTIFTAGGVLEAVGEGIGIGCAVCGFGGVAFGLSSLRGCGEGAFSTLVEGGASLARGCGDGGGDEAVVRCAG